MQDMQDQEYYMVLNKKLRLKQITHMLQTFKIMHHEHDGTPCLVAIVDTYKQATPTEEDHAFLFTESKKVEDLPAFIDDILTTPNPCFLLKKGLSNKHLFYLRNVFDILRFKYQGTIRFAIPGGVYTKLQGDRPPQLIDQEWN